MYLQEIVDRLAIKDLCCRYAQALDRQQLEALQEIFVPGGVVESPVKGYRFEGVQGICEAMATLKQYKCTTHAIHNQVVEIVEDTATAETYGEGHHIYEQDGKEYKLTVGLRYLDTLVRMADGWRIVKRQIYADWEQSLPLVI